MILAEHGPYAGLTKKPVAKETQPALKLRIANLEFDFCKLAAMLALIKKINAAVVITKQA